MKSFFKNNKKNYQEYLKTQEYHWSVKNSKIRNKFEYHAIINHIDDANIFNKKKINGLCLGARNNYERDCFVYYLNELGITADVLSVDLSEKANVDIKCDFNNLPQNFANKYNFIYSNCLDHTFDLKETLKEWKRVVVDGGI